jgi:hypothetical protein
MRLNQRPRQEQPTQRFGLEDVREAVHRTVAPFVRAAYRGTLSLRRERKDTGQRTFIVAGPLRTVLRHRFVAIGAALATLFVTATPAATGMLDASWTMPMTNDDGSALTNLASFKLYYGMSDTPCPGSSFISVTAPTSAPGQNQTAMTTLTGLTTGAMYFAAVTAVTSSGSESACSEVSSAIARSDLSITPSGTVDFGTVTVGAVMDQTFTVKNTGGGIISGTVTTSAPFSVLSGSSFNLVGVGATATVTVRFTPAMSAVATTNVTFTVNGGGVSRTVMGTGAAVDSMNNNTL